MATFSQIKIKFTQDLAIGKQLGFNIYTSSPFGFPTALNYIWNFVANRVTNWQITAGTGTGVAGEITAINFANAFQLDVSGYQVIRTGNEVLIKIEHLIPGTVTEFSYGLILYNLDFLGGQLIPVCYNDPSVNVEIQNMVDPNSNPTVIPKAGIELLEWKVDNVETLTTAYFNENNVVVGGPTTNWKFAKANLDGTNRIAELLNPLTFNPFVQEFGLLFDAVNYFSGKPTGTVSGSDYGTGILEIGTDKPIILNGSLQEKKGAFFIDIDYTKNLKIRFNVIVNKNNNNIFTTPEIYREYTIEWNAETCTKSFFYKDKTQVGEPVIDQLVNGFLSGVTPFVSEDIQTNVGNFTEIVWNDTNTTENRSGGSATETIYFDGVNYPTNSIIWQRGNGGSFFDDSTVVNVTGTFNLNLGINEFRLKGVDNYGTVVYSNVLRYIKSNVTKPHPGQISIPIHNNTMLNICIAALSDGGSPITECGVVYNIAGNPTVADTKILYANQISIQCQDFTRPTAGVSYYFAAFFTNEVGTSYIYYSNPI